MSNSTPQAIQRNKEQQLQIRQAAIHNMRYSQAPPTGQPGPTQQQQMATPSQQSTNQQTPAQQQPVCCLKNNQDWISIFN